MLTVCNVIDKYVFLYFDIRNKSGIWGWRSEKSEVVSGYEAKVSKWPDTVHYLSTAID